MSDRVSNSDFASDNQHFIDACKLAGVTPSARQASKWRNGKGAAAKNAGRDGRRELPLPTLSNPDKQPCTPDGADVECRRTIPNGRWLGRRMRRKHATKP